ncbi:MAG: phosphodiester glycosidase family protein [Rhodoluna sp.]|nr:phosphodiester glycosidase family protein [Rhodoluna sp.]
MPAANASWCKPAPTLSSSTFTPRVTYSNGASFGYYSLPTGAGTLSNYPTRIGVFKGEIAKSKMTSPFAPFGLVGNQRTFANSVSGLQTYVNTDFIGSNNMPYSAIISAGELVYAPATGSIGDPSRNGTTRVIGWAKTSYSEAAGFAVASPLTSGALSFSVAGVNLKSFPVNSIVAFTPKNASKSVPRGQYAILVSKSKVTMTYLKGTTIRPASGVLFQATGTAVALLKRLTNGKAAVYKMPPLTKSSLVADTVAPTGYVQIGTEKLKISAVNFVGGNGSGATMYDKNFGTATLQTIGAATFALDNTGVVQKISSNRGIRIAVNSTIYTRVFQVASTQAYLVGRLSVGQKLTVVNRYSSANHNNLVSASGRGSILLKDGANVEDCNGTSEEIRPRTVIGWNESGQFWVATSTMGMSWSDNGYRLGGSTIHQMGEWLKQFGATQAVSVDGGGSTAQFVTINGAVTRQDLPENEWIRDVPVGLAISANG